jgi:hypothetical protein
MIEQQLKKQMRLAARKQLYYSLASLMSSHLEMVHTNNELSKHAMDDEGIAERLDIPEEIVL